MRETELDWSAVYYAAVRKPYDIICVSIGRFVSNSWAFGGHIRYAYDYDILKLSASVKNL